MPCYDKKLEASREQLRLPGAAEAGGDASAAAAADMEVDEGAGAVGPSGVSADNLVPGTDLVLTTGEARTPSAHPGPTPGRRSYLMRHADSLFL